MNTVAAAGGGTPPRPGLAIVGVRSEGGNIQHVRFTGDTGALSTAQPGPQSYLGYLTGGSAARVCLLHDVAVFPSWGRIGAVSRLAYAGVEHGPPMQVA